MKPHHRLALLGLALGVLLALLLAPQTRWLVRLQALTSLRLYHPLPSGPCYTSSENDQRQYAAAAARHPDDFATQYAATVSAGGTDETLAGLRALTSRFPGQPALYANILRYETISSIRLIRPEENLLMRPSDRRATLPASRSTAQDLADYDRAAAAGERLDPENAYFPLMRAVGLFAAFRDTDGLAAFQRASQKPVWREYCADDVEARWRLHEEAFGDPGALARVTISASLLLPQFSRIRALARLILVKAIQQEQAGHREEGLRLRESLRRCGDLMRVQSTDAIEALVAIAICTIATDRPGGVTTPDAAPALTADERRRLRLDAYSVYVTRLGHPEAAARARAEEAVGRQVTAVLNFDDPARADLINQPLLHLIYWWLGGVAVLSNVLWLLLLGGLAAALARTLWAAGGGAGQWKDEKPTLSRKAAMRRGIIAVGLSAAGFLLADSLLHFFQPPDLLGGVVRGVETLLLLLLVFALPPVLAVSLMRHGFRSPLPRSSWPNLRRWVWLILVIGVCLYGFCALLGWQAGSLSDLTDGLRSLGLLGMVGADSDAAQTQQVTARWLSIAAVSVVPLLLLLISGIAARIRHVPFPVGVVQGFRAAALPLACLLLLVWGGLLMATVRQERTVNAQVRHQVHDEGPYLAAQAGQPWPGPVR